MRPAGHSSAALLLVGTAIAAVVAALALNSLFEPSLPPPVNAIEIREPRGVAAGETGPEPAPKQSWPTPGDARRVPAPAAAPAPPAEPDGDDLGDD